MILILKVRLYCGENRSKLERFNNAKYIFSYLYNTLIFAVV